MHIKVFFLFGVLVMWERAQSAPCNCGLGSGVNICSENGGPCSPLVVRPRELPAIDLDSFSKPRIIVTKVGGGVGSLKPVGGLCSCGQTIIKPAVVPRPACASCSGSSVSLGSGGSYGSSGPCASGLCGSSGLYQSSSSGSSSSQSSQSSSSQQILTQGSGGSISVQFPACGPPVFNQPRPQVPQVPADVVSQDIAYRQKQQQRNDKAELKLAYGFQRIPAEAPCAAKKRTFREGNIQLVNGQVLELANFAPKQDDSEEEEFIEEEEPEEVEVLTPSFGDLGYRLANYNSGKFINVVNEEEEQATCDSGSDIVPACNDGYRGGEVIIREGQVNSQIPPQLPISPICDDGDTPYQGSSDSGYYAVPSYSSYSASSSSASNNAQSQLFLRKLSCS